MPRVKLSGEDSTASREPLKRRRRNGALQRGVLKTTPEAERIGAVIIQLYRQGVKDSGKLADLAKTYL